MASLQDYSCEMYLWFLPHGVKHEYLTKSIMKMFIKSQTLLGIFSMNHWLNKS